jgi:hypothetical protein
MGAFLYHLKAALRPGSHTAVTGEPAAPCTTADSTARA